MDFDRADNPVSLHNNYVNDGKGTARSVTEFIDKLFENGDGQVRNPGDMTTGILNAAAADKTGYWLISEQTQKLILRGWLSIWTKAVLGGGGLDSRLQQTDIDLFTQIAHYAQAHELTLFVPKIEYLRPRSDTDRTPVYKFKGYDKGNLFYPNQKSSSSITTNIGTFLELFATGAHFVAISSPEDLSNGIDDFYELFATELAGTDGKIIRQAGPLNKNSGTANMHSHYAGAPSDTFKPVSIPLPRGMTNIAAGYAYPASVQKSWTYKFGKLGAVEFAPNPCPFVCSLLVDTTARQLPNSFFQLEGWPGVKAFGAVGRHGQDFAVHKATKWNISTYGASPFSEKRGTTVFLAPATWTPPIRTIMWPSYQGSTTLQGWYDSDLITLDTP